MKDVILGDNCTDADISREVKNFNDGALSFSKKSNTRADLALACLIKSESLSHRPAESWRLWI